MITIVDYGMGNLGSIRNMLKKVGFDSRISFAPEHILDATKLILPGVGSFDAGMENLERSGLIPLLNERVMNARVPILGICLGMQLMARSSAEGRLAGLGWLRAAAHRFPKADGSLKVPHMGWNLALPVRTSPLLENLPAEPRFYFVHSYYIHCDDTDDVLMTTQYGLQFHSAFQRANIAGVQFHPEKSHKFGMRLLRNFAEIV